MKIVFGRRAAALLATTLTLAVGGAFALAPQEPGTVEGAVGRAAEKLDEAGRQIKQGLERGFGTARDAVRDSFSRTRDRVNDMNVEARVYGRIHWDKLLTTSSLSLSVEARGIVTLRGAVPDAEAKKRAVELAADTVGVSRVIDQLVIQTPSAATTTTTTTTTVKPAPKPAPDED